MKSYAYLHICLQKETPSPQNALPPKSHSKTILYETNHFPVISFYADGHNRSRKSPEKYPRVHPRHPLPARGTYYLLQSHTAHRSPRNEKVGLPAI